MSSISTELTVLSDRLYVQTNIDSSGDQKRQTRSTKYSILAPVVFTINIMNDTALAEDVTNTIETLDDSTSRNEIVGFNAVGMLKQPPLPLCSSYISCLTDVCKCIPNPEDPQQSLMVDICIGTSVKPCICNDSGCRVSGTYALLCMLCIYISILH